jgi:predicted Zn-dependent protease
MSDVLSMLGRVSEAEGGGDVPKWLSTHPSAVDRIQNVSGAIALEPRGEGDTLVQRDAYLDRLDGLVIGADLRGGYWRGKRFVDPDDHFGIEFPESWRTGSGSRCRGDQRA